MPEGHTIHRLARDLTRDFAAQNVAVSSPQGRFASAAVLDGHMLLRAHAIGKHLFIEFAPPNSAPPAAYEHLLHIHLGLFGKFKRVTKARTPAASVRLRMEGESKCWQLTGPTACERIDDTEFAALRARLGADPLSDAPRSPRTWGKVHASKRSIGALLLDQSIFAGIGNVYRAELLFLIGTHPELPGNALAKPTFEKLWKLARSLLARGVQANRIVTVAGANRSTRKREALYVYKQKFCRTCESSILSSTNATRTMYHCPHCQQLPECD